MKESISAHDRFFADDSLVIDIICYTGRYSRGLGVADSLVRAHSEQRIRASREHNPNEQTNTKLQKIQM